MDLTDYPPFRNLNQTQIDNFVGACTEVSYDAGKEIITQGKRGTSVYFLLSGEVRVYLPNAKAHGELGRLGPPAVVGEMELLTGKPRSASVEATANSRLLQIPFETLRGRIEDGDPGTLKVMYNIATVLAQRLHSVTEKLGEVEADEERCEELRDFRVKLFADWTF